MKKRLMVISVFGMCTDSGFKSTDFEIQFNEIETKLNTILKNQKEEEVKILYFPSRFTSNREVVLSSRSVLNFSEKEFLAKTEVQDVVCSVLGVYRNVRDIYFQIETGFKDITTEMKEPANVD